MAETGKLLAFHANGKWQMANAAVRSLSVSWLKLVRGKETTSAHAIWSSISRSIKFESGNSPESTEVVAFGKGWFRR
jgi:hypothetical protein